MPLRSRTTVEISSVNRSGPLALVVPAVASSLICGTAMHAGADPVIPDCTLRDPYELVVGGGHFCGGESAQVNLPMAPEDEVRIDVSFDSDNDHIGMAVHWRVMDQTGAEINWDAAAVYGVVADTMWDRGDAGSCGHASTFEVECDVFCGTWSMSADIIRRDRWNEAGTDFASALPVGLSSTWCGSVNGVSGCENDPVWSVDLETGDTLRVAAGLTASGTIGCALNLDLYDPAQQYQQHLFTAAAYGTAERYATYVHTSDPGTYYLVLDRIIWDLWRYAIAYEIVREAPCDLVVALADYPVSITPGEILSFMASASNGCLEELSLDRAEMVITGPAGLSRDLYDGAPIPIEPDGSVNAQVDLAVPPATPLGSYTVTVTAYRGFEAIDTDAFQIEVEGSAPRFSATMPEPILSH